jgi:hypothetical protein
MSGSMSGDWRRSHGASIATPPDERGGNGREAPTTTAPVVDSTRTVEIRSDRDIQFLSTCCERGNEQQGGQEALDDLHAILSRINH